MGKGNLKSLPPGDRHRLTWRNRVTNPQLKYLTQTFACLKEHQVQKIEKRLKERQSNDKPNFGSISWEATKG